MQSRNYTEWCSFCVKRLSVHANNAITQLVSALHELAGANSCDDTGTFTHEGTVL